MSTSDDDKHPDPHAEPRPPSPFGDAEGLGESGEAEEETAFTEEPAEAPVKKAHWGRRILIALVIVIVVFAAGLFTMPQIAPQLAAYLPADLVYGPAQTDRLAALESRIATLESASAQRDPAIAELQANTAKTDALARDVASRLDNLQIPDLSGDVAAIEKQVRDLESRMAGADEDTRRAIANDVAAEIATVTGRLAAVETALAQAAESRPSDGASAQAVADAAAVTALTARLASAERAIADVRGDSRRLDGAIANIRADVDARFDALAARVGGLESAVTAESGPMAPAGTAFILAVSQLRDAVDGGRAYATELDAVRAVTQGNTYPGLGAALDGLAPAAGSGIADMSKLQASFGDAARAALKAARSAGDDWVARTVDRLSSVISIRRTGDVAGDEPDAVLARAEVHLTKGDIAAALAELDALPDTAAAAMASWRKLAQDHVAAKTALRDLQTVAIAGLKS
jgi:hypothetical protein